MTYVSVCPKLLSPCLKVCTEYVSRMLCICILAIKSMVHICCVPYDCTYRSNGFHVPGENGTKVDEFTRDTKLLLRHLDYLVHDMHLSTPRHHCNVRPWNVHKSLLIFATCFTHILNLLSHVHTITQSHVYMSTNPMSQAPTSTLVQHLWKKYVLICISSNLRNEWCFWNCKNCINIKAKEEGKVTHKQKGVKNSHSSLMSINRTSQGLGEACCQLAGLLTLSRQSLPILPDVIDVGLALWPGMILQGILLGT